MAKNTQSQKSAVKAVVKEERKNISYEVREDLGQFADYRTAALIAAQERESGRIARAVRKVIYLVEQKPRVIH
jgi:hypothetical protein